MGSRMPGAPPAGALAKEESGEGVLLPLQAPSTPPAQGSQHSPTGHDRTGPWAGQAGAGQGGVGRGGAAPRRPAVPAPISSKGHVPPPRGNLQGQRVLGGESVARGRGALGRQGTVGPGRAGCSRAGGRWAPRHGVLGWAHGWRPCLATLPWCPESPVPESKPKGEGPGIHPAGFLSETTILILNFQGH